MLSNRALMFLMFYPFVMFSCTEKEEKESAISTYENSTIQKLVDSTTVNFEFSDKNTISFFYQDYYGETSSPYDLSTNGGDTTFRFLFDRDINLFILNSNRTNTFAIHPGETIDILIGKENRLSVKGNKLRSNEINFISSLNKDMEVDLEGFYAHRPSTNAKINKVIEEENNLYAQRISYFENYIRFNPVSVSFEKTMRHKIYAICYNNILEQYTGGLIPIDKNIDDYVSSQKSINIDTDEVDSRAFNYTRYLALKQSKTKPTAPELFDIALREFEGKTLDRILYICTLLAFRQKNTSLTRMVKKFNSIATDEYLKKYSEENFSSVEVSEINKGYGANELVTPNDKIITWSNLISSKEDTVVYVDFWASWCAPCIAEIPSSCKLKASFKNKKVSFIYISIDDISTSWKSSLNRTKLIDFESDNFRLKSGNKSKIKESLKVSEIPRYMIIDKKGKIQISNANRPSDSETFELINSFLIK